MELKKTYIFFELGLDNIHLNIYIFEITIIKLEIYKEFISNYIVKD